MKDASEFTDKTALDGQSWRWEIWPMTFGKYRVVLTDGFTVEDFFCMENLELAVKAQHGLVFQGKMPKDGWTRCSVRGKIYYPDTVPGPDPSRFELLMANGDIQGPDEECKHDWQLTFRDGPLDRNDWHCPLCGKQATTFGPSEENKPK